MRTRSVFPAESPSDGVVMDGGRTFAEFCVEIATSGYTGQMRVTLQSTGNAPAPEVWERYMEPTAWRTWAPQIIGVEYRGERLDGDTTGRVLGPLGVPIDFRVHSVDERSWTWAWSAWFQNQAIGVDLTHGVVSRPNGTRAWLTIDGPLPLVLPYLPVAKFALGRLCSR